MWTELSSERVLRAVEAALAALHILTAQNMPKRAYLEEVIERIVQLARFQLQHSIYPAYDPVYRTESKKDVTISGILLLIDVLTRAQFNLHFLCVLKAEVQRRKGLTFEKYEIKQFYWSIIKW